MWDELYRRHYPELLRYAQGMSRSREQAEDLTQETFLKALQNTDTLEDLGPNQRRAWLFRTMKNLYFDQCRRAALEAAYAKAEEAEAASPEPGYEAAEEEWMLDRLQGLDRALFHLRYMEGYSAQELGEMFNLPAGTVRSKLSRARACLKKHFSGSGNT